MKHAITGPQTAPLKTTVADEVADDFRRFCRERGYGSTSDCLRELVLVAVYGVETLADLHRERIASLHQKQNSSGPSTGPPTTGVE